MNLTNSEPMSFHVALVVSEFNREITQALHDGAVAHLKTLGFAEHHITVIWVPGAFEIPLVCQRLAQSDRFEAMIALGAVIRGETTHYDYVCEQVSSGCQRVALDNDIPVIFGVITTENEEQAQARVGGAHGHKGVDAVNAAVHMVNVLRKIRL